MRIIPDYCKDCWWFLQKMGACPTPTSSIFYTIISLIPYFIIFYLIGVTILKRKTSLIKFTSMLVVAYIIGDKILKNIFRGQRPPFSCKHTYGMPSSHMTVIVAFSFYFIKSSKISISTKVFLVILCILQGIARIQLHYHTLEQVFGGVLFGTVFAVMYFKCFDLIWSKIHKNIPAWIPIIDDENKEQKEQIKQKNDRKIN